MTGANVCGSGREACRWLTEVVASAAREGTVHIYSQWKILIFSEKKYRLQTRRHMKYLMQAERLQPRAGTGRRSGADMGRQLLTKLSPHADRPDLILACLQVWGQRWPFHLISERRRHREKHARPESAGALMSHVWCCRIGQGSGSQGQGTRRRKEQPGGQRICPECGAGCAACPAAARSTTGVRSVWR